MTARTTRHAARTFRLFSLCALFTMAGCFKLARPTPPLEEYVLGGGSTPARGAAARDTGGVTVGLRRLDLAPYLATTAIVTRQGSRIVTSGFHRWGEEPSAGIMRAVAGYLGASPSILAVDVAPWPVRTQHDYLVQLHVSRMEGIAPNDSTGAAAEVRLSASWEIIRAQDGALLARGETEHREAGWRMGEYHGLVTRLEKGFNGLASDLAACLARLSPAMPAASAASAGASTGASTGAANGTHNVASAARAVECGVR